MSRLSRRVSTVYWPGAGSITGPFCGPYTVWASGQWRLGQFAVAQETFRRLWRFDPNDSLNARDLMLAVQAGLDYLAWRDEMEG